ncbi:hypothetical protein LCGC14_0544330 [marine sediment metagenome]|uniref:Uncharacterized protein n=1 Tax=marine sediment metagenome TaxID=412755 RepID=A0A0F9UD77_9ZZZZ
MDDRELIFTEQADKHRDAHRAEKEQENKAKDEGIDTEKRCVFCGDSLLLYNDELIIDEACPYCSAKRVREILGKKTKIVRQKREGIMDKEIVVKDAIVMPAVTAEKAVEAFNAYQELANKIIRPEDIQKISGKDFKKKSFWRKCQRFFNLSLEKLEEKREEYGGHGFTYHFTYRATAPNGAFMDGCGSCSSDEKDLLKTEHNTRAIAETRAKNRAIADLVAFGECSAEEIVEAETLHPEPETQLKFENRLISEKQRKRLFAISKSSNMPDDKMKEFLFDKFGYDSSSEIKVKDYENIVNYASNYKN